MDFFSQSFIGSMDEWKERGGEGKSALEPIERFFD